MTAFTPALTAVSVASPSRRTTASLAHRYGLILAAVAGLLVVDQAVLQPRLAELSVFAPRINIAGRQRMLSQKLVKAGLALEAAPDETTRERRRRELQDTLAQWQSAHAALLQGSSERGLPATTTPEIRQTFAQLQPSFQALVASASALAAGEMLSQGAVLLEQEARYLPLMDRIVGLYEAEAKMQARALRVLGLAAAGSIVGLMLALGRLVLRPATQTIQKQMESLEERVAERTAELTELNKDLAYEVHERQQAEQRTRELSGQLAHTSRVLSLGQLAVGLAHEINQPLTAVANYAECCDLQLDKGAANPAELKPMVQQIRGAALRAGAIVRSMRDFLRPGQTPTTRVDVNQLVREVLAFCRLELARGHVRVELELGDGDFWVQAAVTQIQQVLVNLLQNAIQALEACPADERAVTIRTSCRQRQVQVEVLDAGPGFSCQDPETLFEPFFTTKESGLGMGLAIARSIIREHSGRLWAENLPRGAAVCFTLPLELEHDDHLAVNTDCVCRG